MRLSGWITSAAALSVFALSTAVLALGADDKMTFDDLPKVVKKTVNAKYPGAKFRGVAKEKGDEGQAVYEVEMTVKGKAIDIIVDAEGDIETIEEAIDAEDLPKAVQAAAARNFPKGKIEKAEKVTDEDKKVTYEVFIKVGDKEPEEVLMSPDGKVIKPGAKKEKEEDDEKEEKAKPKAD